jgi:tetratricopeptide (TPR) repeat protein
MKRFAGAILAFAVIVIAASTAQASLQYKNQPQQSAPQGQSGQGGKSGQAAAPSGPPQPSPAETKAYLAIQGELDPTRQLQLVDDFAKTYPSSMLLSDAYFLGSYANEQKGDLPKAIDYCNKSLQAKPDNLRSLLTRASLLPRPEALQGSDADKEKNLSNATADANKALELIPNLNPPNQTPEQLTQLKANLTSEVHSSLGMVHLQRAMMNLSGPDPAELAKAEQEYNTAVTGTQQPDPSDYYRLGEVYRNENKLDDAITAFNKASQLGQGSPVQAMAQQQVQELEKRKAQASQPPPAKP